MPCISVVIADGAMIVLGRMVVSFGVILFLCISGKDQLISRS